MNAAFESYGHFFTARYIDGKPLMMVAEGHNRPIMYKDRTPTRLVLGSYSTGGGEVNTNFVSSGGDFIFSAYGTEDEETYSNDVHLAYWKMPQGSTFGITFSWSFSFAETDTDIIDGFSSIDGVITPASFPPYVPIEKIVEEERAFFAARSAGGRIAVPPQSKSFLIGGEDIRPSGTDTLEFYEDEDGGIRTRKNGDSGLPPYGSASISGLPLWLPRGGLYLYAPFVVSGAGSVTVRITFNPPE